MFFFLSWIGYWIFLGSGKKISPPRTKRDEAKIARGTTRLKTRKNAEPTLY
jgi:hypothetical protein